MRIKKINYKLKKEEDKHSFVRRCAHSEVENGRDYDISCKYCLNLFYRLNGNFTRDLDDKFIYQAF